MMYFFLGITWPSSKPNDSKITYDFFLGITLSYTSIASLINDGKMHEFQVFLGTMSCLTCNLYVYILLF